ncbi:hypothetical protein FB645_000444 [Coemansia sp. IMI 203386]|nr:hypothetical protein FB645_000444 [Coemansia sp. IMI 203386]
MSDSQESEHPRVVIKRLYSKNDRAVESYSQPIVFEMPSSLELRALNDLVETTWYIAPGYQVFVVMHPDGSISRLDIKEELKSKTIWSRQLIYAYNSKYFEEVDGNLLTVPQQQGENDDINSQMQTQIHMQMPMNMQTQKQKQGQKLVQNSYSNSIDEADAKTICPSSLSTSNSETTFSISSPSPSFSFQS